MIGTNQLINHLGKLPIKTSSLLMKLQILTNQQQNYQKALEINSKAIEQQFISMIHQIFCQIQPNLCLFKEYSNLQYLYPSIANHLPKFYGKNYLYQIPSQTQNNGNLFEQLLNFMSILLKQYQIYYEVQGNSMENAISIALLSYIEQNSQSQIIQSDYEERLEFDKIINQIPQEEQIHSKYLTRQTFIQSLNPLFDYVHDSKLSNLVKKPFNKIMQIKHQVKSQQQVENDKRNQQIHLKSIIKKKQPISNHQMNIVLQLMEIHKYHKYQQLPFVSPQYKFQLQKVIGLVFNEYNQNEILLAGLAIEYKETVIKKLMEFMDYQKKEQSNAFTNYDNEETEIITLMVQLYQYLSNNKNGYDRQSRRVYQQIAYQFQQMHQNINLCRIIKIIQSYEIKATELHKILNSQQTMFNSCPLFNNNNIINISQQKSQLSLNEQIYRIHLFNLNKSQPIPENFELHRVTNTPLRKSVTILVSGFLSQDSDKFDEWSDIVHIMHDSEVYALKWASKSVQDLLYFTLHSCKDILTKRIVYGIIGGPFVKAISIVNEIYKKYQNNPFNPAFQNAILSGIYLAQLLISTFPNTIINLVGFSLGTELIRSTLQHLHSRKKLNILNRVILMGSVVDKQEIQSLLKASKQPIFLTNLYSKNDLILKYLLKVCKPLIMPIGNTRINPINPHQIHNIQVSQYVDGHLGYRESLQILGKISNLNLQ